MSNYLPLEMLQQIFLRLPIKNLLCCTTICMTWYNLITSPKFIHARLDFNKSLQSSKHILIQDCPNKTESDIGLKNYFFVLYSDNEAGTFEEYVRFQFSIAKSASPLRVVGYSNGLFCLANILSVTVRPQDHIQDVVLWNPMIRRSLHLPKSYPDFTTLDASMGGFFEIRPSPNTFGFVYDHIGNDYKVLRIYSWSPIPPVVEIFRLSTGSWEDISRKAPLKSISVGSPQVYLDGIAHWIGQDNDDKLVIITFDVHEEVFGSIELPVNVVDDDKIYQEKYIFDFEGSLFLISRVNMEQHERKFDVWKMGKYNVVESWNRVHTCVFDITVHLFGFRNNGELLSVENGKRFSSTNLEDASSKYLGMYPNARFYTSFVESLVLLDKSLPSGVDDQKENILQE